MNKRMMSLFLAVLLLAGLMAGCTQQEASDTMKVVFSEKVLNISQISAEDWVGDMTANGTGKYEEVYVNEDGVSVTLEITQEQQKYWLESRAELLRGIQDRFSELGNGYRIDVSEDYRHIDFYYNLELDVYDAVYYVMYAEGYCIDLQLFGGTGAEDWFVSFNIYNSDTGKLVTSGDSNTGLGYETSDWEASE